MRNPLRLAAVVPILALAAASAVFGRPARAEGKVEVGSAAPSFSMTDLEGKPVDLAQVLRSGNVVFLNFWGMRCGNCIAEIGFLNPLSAKYEPEGARFVGVNVDGAPPEMLKRMMPRMPNVPKFTVIPDPDMKIPDLYAVTGTPLSFIIGRDGKIAWRHDDFREGDEKEIERALQAALAANPR
ncbi:MAG: hypothetical protein OHK0028_21230 [Deltaproteobacteria bacterium]